MRNCAVSRSRHRRRHPSLLAVVSTELHPQASAATPQGSIVARVDPNVVVPLQHAPGTTCGCTPGCSRRVDGPAGLAEYLQHRHGADGETNSRGGLQTHAFYGCAMLVAK